MLPSACAAGPAQAWCCGASGLRADSRGGVRACCVLQFQNLYGKKAAALYTQAGDYQKTARFYYKKAEDTYYQVRFPTSERGGWSRRGRQSSGCRAPPGWSGTRLLTGLALAACRPSRCSTHRARRQDAVAVFHARVKRVQAGEEVTSQRTFGVRAFLLLPY